MANIVEVDKVSRHFKIHHQRHQSLKERLVVRSTASAEDFVALDEVSFTVRSGESVAILGRNGSGKSTLLKAICGVLRPSSGQVRVRGQVSGLLELGAGFQPELTGRENIYLYATMLGIAKGTIASLFDEIVAFAELEQFIDTPVKFYSSGMYVRLAFAVAINIDPDLLVVDEVLAVGDEAFQAKCMARIADFQASGGSILLVSHGASQVEEVCSRAIVLDGGRVVFDGEVSEGLVVLRNHLGVPSDT